MKSDKVQRFLIYQVNILVTRNACIYVLNINVNLQVHTFVTISPISQKSKTKLTKNDDNIIIVVNETQDKPFIPD